MIDALAAFVRSLVEFSEAFVIPDWGELIALLPILLALGAVGPLLTLLVLAWLRYAVVRPRAAVRVAPARRPAALDGDGSPVYPVGEPYSPAERCVYEPGATRSASGEPLLVSCPKCALVRQASVATCGNCGLSFTLRPTARSARLAAPPPGGAAAA